MRLGITPDTNGLQTFIILILVVGEHLSFLGVILKNHLSNTVELLAEKRQAIFLMIIMMMIMNLYSAFSIFIYSNAHYKQVIYGQRPAHNTGNYVPCSLG